MLTLHVGRLYIDIGRIHAHKGGRNAFWHRPPHGLAVAWFAIRGVGASVMVASVYR